MSEKHLVSLSDIEEASKRLTGIIRPTVMVHAGWLERQINQPVYLKPENLQRAGSFKIRGAYNLMSQCCHLSVKWVCQSLSLQEDNKPTTSCCSGVG